jgi:DNA-binding MarR family transcriptional regulator
MADTRWLGERELRAWRAFLDLHAEVEARLNQELQRTSGMSLPDYDVLVHLTDVPEARRRPSELAESLRWEKGRLSKQLARMRARGLVTQEACEHDRRGFYVVLTDRGRQAIEAAAPPHVDLVRRLMFDALTDRQVATLGSTLTSLLDRARANRATD